MSGAIKRKAENGGARHALDKFYTKDDVALECINSIASLMQNADIVVEPSAGAGAFSRQIEHPSMKAYDLEPELKGIQQKNWFDVSRHDIGTGKFLVIGNPPFGVRSDLAKKFINHAVELGADSIAFILPKTFSKAINQKTSLFPSSYRLVLETELKQESFSIEGEDLHIPCKWYVWTKDEDFMKGVDLRKQLLEDSSDFMFATRGSVTADFTINGNSGKVKSLEEVTNPKAEHYIKASGEVSPEELMKRFKNLSFELNSSVNGGVAWLGKQEILAAYKNLTEAADK
jgi:hypothetical protein